MALQRGSTGDDVKALQQQLNAAGYNLDVDGSYGPKTQAAVKDYQTKQGLQVDGIVGSQTSASLAGLTPKSSGGSSGGSSGAKSSGYVPLDTSGRDYATEYGMSDADKQRIADLGTAYKNATDPATKEALHSAAEAIRNSYGYSGGADGSMGTPIETPASLAQKQAQAELNALISEYKNLYSQQNNAYAEALAEQQRAKQAAVDKAVGSLNTQKQTTDTAYADMFRQLYLDKMKNQKNIDQRLAAAGQTGGQAESTLLGLQTGYEDALREGGVSKQTALNQLDQAITDAQLTGDISAAEDAAAMAQKQADNYASVLQDLINRADNIAQQEASQNATNRNYAYQTAMAMLQNGNMASDELLDAAGISKADAATIVASAAAQKAAKTSQEKAKTYTENQANVAYNAIVNGQDTAENRAILEGYYGMPWSDIAAAYGLSSKPGTVGAFNGSNVQVDMDEYDERAGNFQQVRDYAQRIYETQGKQKALEFIKDAYYGDVQILNFGDYTSLYNAFRNK